LHGLLKKFVVEENGEVKIPVNKFLQYTDTSLLYEVFKKFGFGEKQLPEILKLANSESGSYLQSETHRIIKHRKWFIIALLDAPPTHTIVVNEGTKKVTLPNGDLRLKTLPKDVFHLDTSAHMAQLDHKMLSFPLIVRRWKNGDYFYPLGIQKKKKLARFFIDLKLSTTDKEKIWVVESQSRIVWIVGHRIDNRVKVTDTTKKILQLTFVPH